MGFRKFKRKQSESKKPPRKSRKEERKELRNQKKLKRSEYLVNRSKHFSKNKPKFAPGDKKLDVGGKSQFRQIEEKILLPDKTVGRQEKVNKQNTRQDESLSRISKDHLEDRKTEVKLKEAMVQQRKKQLIEANKEEDKTIKRLEKQLKMKKKGKSTPRSFIASGLDYILDVCDSDKIQAAAVTEENLLDSGGEFEEDMAVIMGKKIPGAGKIKKKEKNNLKKTELEAESDCEFSQSDSEGLSETEDLEGEEEDTEEEEMDEEEEDYDSEEGEDVEESEDDVSAEEDGRPLNNKKVAKETVSQSVDINKKRKTEKRVTFSGIGGSDDSESDALPVQPNSSKKRKLSGTEEDSGDDDGNEEVQDDDDDDDYYDSDDLKTIKKSKFEDEEGTREKKLNKDGTWEDIYGRLRDKQGNVIQETKSKYVPPHLRGDSGCSDKKKEELTRLKKEMKGLLNRLAENNMYSISNQIEELYMKNSRNDMNETMISLLMDSLVSQVSTPERLIMEHAMLITILHSNVGTEIGAYVLQKMVKQFDEMHSSNKNHPVENKELDNLLLIICHLYTFKVFNSGLVYELLGRLCDSFGEKEVDLIVLVLRSVGFLLRKDDPSAMKNLLLRVQRLAGQSQTSQDNSRVRFMLDILLTIKNNNMAKLPQYDPTHSEHLRKILRTMLRKGNYVTELNIALDDLLKADERGKWWVVGSAWTGSAEKGEPSSGKASAPVMGELSQELLSLAKKQRMNTANRRNIFCILMSAEDYLDAFEKLLKLGLKGQPEQEIIHVLLHCLLQEKEYNPYYAHIASQLCISDRKHQMTIQYSVWDKIKELSGLKPHQITNLAKFLGHLFLEKSLPISVLKILHFAEMDKPCVRLLRQVLLTVLMHSDASEVTAVFTRVSQSENLAMFRESLRLFLHHFVLKNMSDSDLKEKAELADQALAPVSRKKIF